MPLGSEFKHHLRELFAEVVEDMAETEARYKNELIWKARQTHNSAAMPKVYSDAELHRVEVRFTESLGRYLEALAVWNIRITDEVEREMVQEIQMLTAGPHSLSFPPGLQHDSLLPATQRAFAQARTRLELKLVRQGRNRLREMKAKQANERPTGFNVTIFNANGNNNSQIQGSGNAVQQNIKHSVVQALTGALQQQVFTEFDQASAGNSNLEAKAAEIRRSPDDASRLEKVKQWLATAVTIEGVAEKVHTHLPALLSFLHQHGLSL